MKKMLAAGAVAGFILLSGGMAPAHAAPPAEQICPPLESGKIDVAEGVKVLPLEAPEGFVIAEVCAKGGSAKNGGGIQSFFPNSTTANIYLDSGKDISHYSVRYAEAKAECDYDYGYGYGGY